MKKRIQKEVDFEKILAMENLPKFYANGFNNGLGIGDVVIAFHRNFQPEVVVNLSYTVAKTLAIKLNDLIVGLEKATGNIIMTTDQIDKSMSEEVKGKEEK
jgi:ferredoxin-fold anticodon binding domain-containing protein